MTRSARYSFRTLTLADAPLLARWRAQPHIHRWWGEERPYDADALRDPRVSRWIVALNTRPMAFLQDYSVHGWDEGHHFAHLPAGARGIDQYIGPPELLGRGHGPAFIATHLRSLLAQGAPLIATDPHPENRRAIAAYGKLGFRPAGPVEETGWGPILPMHLRPQTLRRPNPDEDTDHDHPGLRPPDGPL
ncbi:GNAT family N-acetyltransferase [Dinoroseobacter sp. S375]|uniref:GNAT family N-acetyltransferase n=1 Tax=Dinoroseobacter sp. S375 TaxID=3415136 RepID=UPI003C7D0661